MNLVRIPRNGSEFATLEVVNSRIFDNRCLTGNYKELFHWLHELHYTLRLLMQLTMLNYPCSDVLGHVAGVGHVELVKSRGAKKK